MNIDRIKNDLLEKVANDKYYMENDLVRLIYSNEISYKDLVNEIDLLLGKIAIANTKIKMINQYFTEKENKEGEIKKADNNIKNKNTK